MKQLPMKNAQTIAQWQQFLQALLPVEGWLYIGAGRGEALREPRFAKVPRLLAVEAEQHTSQVLAHAIAAHSNDENRNWKALHALANNTDGQATWHQLSREEESGLLPVEALRALWPNLNEHQQAERPAASLSHLLKQAGESQEDYNWLTIDCLPAAKLLQGLNGALQLLDMIEVRVAVNGVMPRQSGTTLEECDELLLPQGFTRLALQETNNPLIGRALYGRDFKLQLAEALNVYTELESQQNALTLQCDELNAKNEAIHKDSEDLRNELESQRKINTEIENRKEGLVFQCETLKSKNETIQKERKDLHSELEGQKKENTALESRNNRLIVQYDELREKNSLAEEERQDLRRELEKQRSQASETKEKLQQAQADLKEQQRSAQLSVKLLTKVEADTSELRERYAEKVKSEQELKELIKELHAKLQAASHFYHKLEKEHPELLEKL